MPKNILEIQNLRKTYGGNEVLKGIDLKVIEGDFFALLGHNGAGKSTTIGIMTSLVNKDSGTVRIGGIDIDKNFPEARKLIGVVPQEFNFDIFATVYDICFYQAGYYGIAPKLADERIELYLKKLELWDKRKSKARELSGGMKRRLMIARALVHNPKILILDEPTAGVDVELRKTMWEFIVELNRQGTTIILTTHYLEEVEELCQNVAILSGGKIVKNSGVKELLKTLDKEVFVLDLKNSLKQVPKRFDQYSPKLVDENTLELTIKAAESLNHIFEVLSEKGIEVLSMRNKSNRLEQLFIGLTKK
ncbi:ABC transporter ATP-binding protein [Candidatus Gracilibacteria bacterium]|nr:ABC transporter ATP-binding protein [Candidatus Gracilibacteria bacterium]